MDASQIPDIMTLTIEEAKSYILTKARSNTGFHLVSVSGVARELLEAANQRRKANDIMRGVRMETFYPSLGQTPEAPTTEVLYDAVWDLVRDGLLRPGPRFYESDAPDPNLFCLTKVGKDGL